MGFHFHFTSRKNRSEGCLCGNITCEETSVSILKLAFTVFHVSVVFSMVNTAVRFHGCSDTLQIGQEKTVRCANNLQIGQEKTVRTIEIVATTDA